MKKRKKREIQDKDLDLKWYKVRVLLVRNQLVKRKMLTIIIVINKVKC